MTKNTLLSLAAVLLIILGIAMIIIGIKVKILPPPITGIGFIIIALVFFKLRD